MIQHHINRLSWAISAAALLFLSASSTFAQVGHEGFESGDFSAFSWTRSGDALWQIDTSRTHSGSYSAKAGSIGTNQSTTLAVTVTLVTGGQIAFYAYADIGGDYDLLFQIDGNSVPTIDRTADWLLHSYDVSAGTHTFTWTFQKNGTSGLHDDVWLDDITFSAGPTDTSIMIPQEINYQGKIEVNGIPFNGPGKFKFAITNGQGSVYYWTNDATSPTLPNPPANPVQLTVANGILSVRLGNAEIPYMAPVPPSVFQNQDTWLRIWFDDGRHGFKRLSPDQKLASVPYAMIANGVPERSIQSKNLNLFSINPEHIGRNTSIRAYHAYCNGNNSVSMGITPADKYFVITDIFADGAVAEASFTFLLKYRYHGSDCNFFKGWVQQNDVAIKNNGLYSNPGLNAEGGWGYGYGRAGQNAPYIINFKSGIPIPPGSELFSDFSNVNGSGYLVLSGYTTDHAVPIFNRYVAITGDNIDTLVINNGSDSNYILTDIYANVATNQSGTFSLKMQSSLETIIGGHVIKRAEAYTNHNCYMGNGAWGEAAAFFFASLPYHISFQSGIPIPPRSTIILNSSSSTYELSFFVAGYIVQ